MKDGFFTANYNLNNCTGNMIVGRIYMCVCACMCTRVREREEEKGEIENDNGISQVLTKNISPSVNKSKEYEKRAKENKSL